MLFGAGVRACTASSARVCLHRMGQVGPEGAVQAIDARPSEALSAPLITCVRARAHLSRFDVTPGDAAIVAVPITFAPN